MQIFRNDAVLLERYQVGTKNKVFRHFLWTHNRECDSSRQCQLLWCEMYQSSQQPTLCCLRLRVVRIPMQQHQIPIMRTKCRMLYTTLLTTYQVKSAMGFFLLHLVVCVETQKLVAEKAGAEAKIESESYRASLTQCTRLFPPRKSNLAIKNGATRKSEYFVQQPNIPLIRLASNNELVEGNFI